MTLVFPTWTRGLEEQFRPDLHDALHVKSLEACAFEMPGLLMAPNPLVPLRLQLLYWGVKSKDVDKINNLH